VVILQTQLASLTSASAMERRALELGFRPVEPDEVEYLVVPGYAEPEPFSLATTPNLQLSALTIAPEYNQSLFDWMDEKISSSRGMQ
jgi:hypothetical protein